MADITQSFSQLLLTYGPGAMIDLPDHAVIVSGLQGWRHVGADWQPVAEERLVPLLRKQLGDKLGPNFTGLRQPPVYDDERRYREPPGVDVMIFPAWFTVDSAEDEASNASGEKRRILVEFHELEVTKSGKATYRVDGKKLEVNPVRFVAACTKGHLQDIDWRYLAHRDGDRNCRRPLYWVERGVSSDPSDISIRCSCGAFITLGDLYKPRFLGACQCESPWLQPRSLRGETCDKDLRLLPRSATNTYFPQTVSVISLTRSDDRVRQAIEEHRPHIENMTKLPNFLQVLRTLSPTSTAFAEFGDEDILRALADAADGGEGPVQSPKIAEFDLLASGAGIIGHDGPASFIYAETLAPERIGPGWKPFLKGVVKVHRLREVTCLYGFTRLEPPPTSAENELDEIQLLVDGADLARNVEWLPAIEQFGEGIFLHISADYLAAWLESDAMKGRAATLKVGELKDAERFKRSPTHLGAAYWALHSLSHAVMAELALECGYPISSLKERIYASGPEKESRYGILIYTSTAGGQGTLGGLSNMADHIEIILDRAVEKLALCSNDPICAEHQPASDQDDRPLQGSACHACLLLPETSCEVRNTRLDRSLLVLTVLGATMPLFKTGDAK